MPKGPVRDGSSLNDDERPLVDDFPAEEDVSESPEKTPEQRSRDLDICVAASSHCAGAPDQAAAEDEYIAAHGGDLELMRLVRQQARTAPPIPFVFVTDPRAIALQAQCESAVYQRLQTLYEQTQERIKRASAETAESLRNTPGDLEDLHAAAEISPARLFLQLAARGYRIDANASNKPSDVALERILRGVLDAFEKADTKRLTEIASVAEPKPRDMHATPRSQMRTETLVHMHEKLSHGLRMLWGVISLDHLIARKQEVARRYGLSRENVERGARAEFDAFRAAPERWLASAFVESAELVPEVFADRGVRFSVETRYNADGAIMSGPKPEHVAAVERAYKKRIDNWEAPRGEGKIKDRAKLLIESGLKALGMTHQDARDVVSMFRQREERRA